MTGPTIKRWHAQLHALMQQRTPRERRALRLLAWFLALAMAAQGLWALETNRRNLRQQLPQLAAQAEQMGHLHQVWQQLSADAAASPTPDNATAKLEIGRRLTELGNSIQAQWSASGELTLKGKTDFATWVTWTAALQEEHHLVLTHCRVVPTNGGIEIDARYRRPTP